MRPLTCGSLFSGIGGMDLGLQRAGFQIKWHVEIGEFQRGVLSRRFHDSVMHDDIRTWPSIGCCDVDLICGGFPCTDISSAGRKAGIHGRNSGLWFEYHRIIKAMRPRFVLIENVKDLLNRGAGEVLRGLAEIGYNASWRTFSSCEFGYPYMRKRLFILACSDIDSKSISSIHAEVAGMQKVTRDNWIRKIQEVSRGNGGDDRAPSRVDIRCRSVGNAVVPDIAEWIGRQLVSSIRTNDASEA